jgi:UDP-glucose 4-epimerase
MSLILVTGGAGYIGSHTLVELLAAGHRVVCLDNYSNSVPEALARVREIAGRDFVVVQGDVRDAELLASLFAAQTIDAVIHFAALKAVGESVQQPLAYYENNVYGSIVLLQAMAQAGVNRIVFSSSATVYGTPQHLPLTEDAPLAPANPYGQTKAMVEQLLRDVCRAQPTIAAIALRYFNPVGAHPSGRIGEDPADTPNNLFPFITQVAIGRRPFLNVWGNDWPTPDGTGVRDYLHVVDLALGHVRALDFALRAEAVGFHPINLGTGHGTSVLEMVKAFEQASGRTVTCKIGPRRDGDIASCWADPARAQRVLGWRAERTLRQMCEDGWRWQSRNPHGYRAAG